MPRDRGTVPSLVRRFSTLTASSLLRLPLLSISSLSSLLPAGRGKNSLVLINTLFGHLAVISLRVFRQALLRWPLLELQPESSVTATAFRRSPLG